jgi:hypothetical protein
VCVRRPCLLIAHRRPPRSTPFGCTIATSRSCINSQLPQVSLAFDCFSMHHHRALPNSLLHANEPTRPPLRHLIVPLLHNLCACASLSWSLTTVATAAVPTSTYGSRHASFTFRRLPLIPTSSPPHLHILLPQPRRLHDTSLLAS